MKRLLILSGKGGTGKTTVASAFIKLAGIRAYADCDVDAPNLHLVMKQAVEPERADFFGLPKAVIDSDQCILCGQCFRNCRFHAIVKGEVYQVDPFACEGCGVCEAFCPARAVSMQPALAGETELYASSGCAFSTAKLKMGSGNSGKLVTEVKRRMNTAVPWGTELALIDGSPGIGCPVIASMSDVSMVLIVTEPTVSGLSDLERIIKTAETFQTQAAVCVNKADTNPENAGKIEEFCRRKGLPFVGSIPFDPEAVRAINRNLTIADVDCPSGTAVRKVFENTMKLLFPAGNRGAV